MNALSVSAPLSLAFALASCGGETVNSAGQRCNAVEACGGDLLGTWAVESACIAGTSRQTTPTCSEPITIEVFSPTYAGTITFERDLHYVSTVTWSGSAAATYPAGCLTNGLSCDSLNQSFVQMPVSSGGVKGSGCTSFGADCRCNFSIRTPAHETPGAYSTSGNAVTITVEGRSTVTDYCVEGNRLTLIRQAQETMSDPGLYVEGTGHVVFERR